jgi:hypothetical protein
MSVSLPTRVLYYGKDEPLPERVPLRAGPLSLIYEAGDLRYLRLGEREVVRRIYAAVRDRNWGTVPAEISDLRFQISDLAFRISYLVTHRQGIKPVPVGGDSAGRSAHTEKTDSGGGARQSAARDGIHFVWRGEIVGEPDGTIRFTFDGEAKTTFLKNRIGFCVLHPIRECAGMPCRVEYVNGTHKELSFPRLVAAEQPVEGLCDLRCLAHEVVPGVWAEVRFTGDRFELEDQRNWIEASFKTFCTPLRLPFPVEIKAGTRIQQSVTLRLQRDVSSASVALGPQGSTEFEPGSASEGRQPSEAVTFELLMAEPVPLPSIGLEAPTFEDLRHRAHRMHKRLKALALAHARVDLRLYKCDWIAELFHTLEWTERLKLGLEIALHVSKAAKRELEDFVDYPPMRGARVARVLVFEKGAKSSTRWALELVRRRINAFRPEIPVGGGTSADFYQLNQFRPPAGLCDFICWSMNPQVHAFDNASLAETPQAIPAQIESAREYFPGKPLVVSPVTLKPRFNPVATGPEPPVPPGALPPQVDPRQMSLFGAGWTLAALKQLAQSRVASVTFYEPTGWRGVMETESGSPLPDKFRSVPGGVFPLYHVLADVGEFSGGSVLPSKSSAPLRVQAMVLQKEGRQRVLAANLTGEPQRVLVPAPAERLRVRWLDETNALAAMTEPEAYRKKPGEARIAERGSLELELRPFGLARIDVEE